MWQAKAMCCLGTAVVAVGASGCGNIGPDIVPGPDASKELAQKVGATKCTQTKTQLLFPESMPVIYDCVMPVNREHRCFTYQNLVARDRTEEMRGMSDHPYPDPCSG